MDLDLFLDEPSSADLFEAEVVKTPKQSSPFIGSPAKSRRRPSPYRQSTARSSSSASLHPFTEDSQPHTPPQSYGTPSPIRTHTHSSSHPRTQSRSPTSRSSTLSPTHTHTRTTSLAQGRRMVDPALLKELRNDPDPELLEGFYDKVMVQAEKQLKLRAFEPLISQLNHLATSRHRDPLIYFYLGLCHYYLGRFAQSSRHFGKSVSLLPSATSVYNQALAAARAGMIEEAIDLFSRALRINPKLRDAYVNRGFLLRKENKFREALADYRALAKLELGSKARVNSSDTLASDDFDLLKDRQQLAAEAKERDVLKALSTNPPDRSYSEIELIIQASRRVEIFKSFTNQALHAMWKRIKFISIPKNHRLFEEGDVADAYYVIWRGTMSVRIPESRIQNSILLVGDVTIALVGVAFGDSVAVDGAVRTGACVAEQASELLVFDRETYNMSFASLLSNQASQKREALRRFPMFRRFSEDNLNRILFFTHEKAYKLGDIIIDQGSPPDALYMMLHGSAQVLRRTTDEKGIDGYTEVAVAVEGDVFGERVVLDSMANSDVRVVANCNCRCYRLDRMQMDVSLWGEYERSTLAKRAIAIPLDSRVLQWRLDQELWDIQRKRALQDLGYQPSPTKRGPVC